MTTERRASRGACAAPISCPTQGVSSVSDRTRGSCRWFKRRKGCGSVEGFASGADSAQGPKLPGRARPCAGRQGGATVPRPRDNGCPCRRQSALVSNAPQILARIPDNRPGDRQSPSQGTGERKAHLSTPPRKHRAPGRGMVAGTPEIHGPGPVRSAPWSLTDKPERRRQRNPELGAPDGFPRRFPPGRAVLRRGKRSTSNDGFPGPRTAVVRPEC
jgi:hypothetical protein